ncbi:2-phospho-L-lactate guanylyltransferase [Branchiibius cervicis]|uniref:Phosphoenolpyruvate guanylyltransferase n=1 Tax=Branchiibius cervicis TaxID=908252 RepID=A0ABW2AU37_9MICO
MRAQRLSTWQLVVPVKSRHAAKSRLVPPSGVSRSDLALAFARDTLTAIAEVISADRLFVVTSDDRIRAQLRIGGAHVVDDPGRGLNPAVEAGVQVARDNDSDAPVGILLGDLPALTPGDLRLALAACAAVESAVVPDRSGMGTVLLTHQEAGRVAPRFGHGSALRHGQTARRLDLDLPRLRTDVDDLEALRQAVAMGLGRHTAAVLHNADLDVEQLG